MSRGKKIVDMVNNVKMDPIKEKIFSGMYLHKYLLILKIKKMLIRY